MGVLNRTPDSFSDGGRYWSLDAAVEHAQAMVAAGAAIIDVGGESTRPGAQAVSEADELERVIPLVEVLAASLPVPISIDTQKPAVMAAAVAAGATFINDVSALMAPDALAVAASLGVPVCLMHKRGEPRTMQDAPVYADVVTEVVGFLSERVAACEVGGLLRDRIIVDPGIGFGKTLQHNLRLLNQLDRLVGLAAGVLVGVSRKSMLGEILDADVDARLYGGLAAAVWSVNKGARIIRTHDVKATVDTLNVVCAVVSVGDE